MRTIEKRKSMKFIITLLCMTCACISSSGCSDEVEVVMANGETTVIVTEEGTEVIDPFRYYDIVFSGSNGSGTVEAVASSDNDMFGGHFFSFSFDKSSGLSNGDVIKVSVSPYVINSKEIISPAYKEIKVKGLK